MDEPPRSAAASSEEERLLFAVRSATAQIDPIAPERLFPSAAPAATAAPPQHGVASSRQGAARARPAPPAPQKSARSKRNLLLKLLGLGVAAGLLQLAGSYFDRETEQSDRQARLAALQRRPATGHRTMPDVAETDANALPVATAAKPAAATALLAPAPSPAIQPTPAIEAPPPQPAAVVPVAIATRSTGSFAADVISAAATLPRDGSPPPDPVLAGPARCDAALAALALCAPDAPRQRGGQP